jgi:hypothetical protein
MRHNDQESGRESRLRAHYPWLQTKNSARNEESESSNCLFASTLPGQETSANPLTLMNQKDLATALLTAYVSLRLIAQPNKTVRSPPFSKEAKHCIPMQGKLYAGRPSTHSSPTGAHPLHQSFRILQVSGEPPITQSEDYLTHVGHLWGRELEMTRDRQPVGGTMCEG